MEHVATEAPGPSFQILRGGVELLARWHTSLLIALALLAGCPISSSALQPWPGYPTLQSNTIARPWLILKCAFSDEPATRTLPSGLNPAITDLDTYINLFLTIDGVGTGNVYDYYRDVSYGSISFNASRVVGWVPAPFASNNTLERKARVQQCANAPGAGIGTGGLDPSAFWGIIMVTNAPQDGGACYDGQQPMQIQGKNYNLACVVLDSNSMWTAFAAHEVGHGLGMPHSWDNSPCEYCDPYDVMSALNTSQFFLPNFPAFGAENNLGAGPGLNVPNLLFLGAIPANRIAKYTVGSPVQTFVLTALSHPSSSSPLTVEILGQNPSDIYTLEYRQRDGWDQGLTDGVAIHEYKIGPSPYSYLQKTPLGGAGWTTDAVWSNAALGVSVSIQNIDASSGTATVVVGGFFPQQVGIGGGTSVGPKLAVFQNRLYAAWKGVDSDQRMFWSSFDGTSWAPQQVGIGGGTSEGPSLAVFQNRLYAAWKGVGGDQRMFWSSFDGNSWAPQQVGIGGGTSVGPSLAVFQNRIYAAWKGVDTDQRMFWSSFDGNFWTPQQLGIGGGTSVGPTLAVFQNRLYAAWKGVDTDQRMFWSSFDGNSWAPQQVGIGGGTSEGPSLALFQNRLYAAWKGVGTDQRMFWSSFDGTSWAPQQVGIGGGTSVGPSLAVFQNRLYAAWKGVGTDQRMFWSFLQGR